MTNITDNEITLNVTPESDGWWVDCDLPLEPTYFLSGLQAELTARKLALRLTKAGRDVRVLIRDHAEQTIGIHRYFAP